MSESKVEYVSVKVDVSSKFMDVFGDAVELALLARPNQVMTKQDSVINSLINQAIQKNDLCKMYSQEDDSEVVKIVYDVNYGEDGQRSPEFIVHFRRPKTEKDKEREQAEIRQDLATIQRLAQKQGWSINVFNTPEQYGRFGTVQHTAVSGPPSQTGSYLLWVELTETGTEYPVSFYYDAEKNKWFDLHDNMELDVPSFTAYMGPIPPKVG